MSKGLIPDGWQQTPDGMFLDPDGAYHHPVVVHRQVPDQLANLRPRLKELPASSSSPSSVPVDWRQNRDGEAPTLGGLIKHAKQQHSRQHRLRKRQQRLRGGTVGSSAHHSNLPSGGGRIYGDKETKTPLEKEMQRPAVWKAKSPPLVDPYLETRKDLLFGGDDPAKAKYAGDAQDIDSAQGDYYFKKSTCCFHNEGDDDTQVFDSDSDMPAMPSAYDSYVHATNTAADGTTDTGVVPAANSVQVYDEIKRLEQNVKHEGALINEITRPDPAAAVATQMPGLHYSSSTSSGVGVSRTSWQRHIANLGVPDAGLLLLAAHAMLLSVWLLVGLYNKRQSRREPPKAALWTVADHDDRFEMGSRDASDSNGVYVLWNETPQRNTGPL
jgi:hypothetical protein